MNAPTVRAQRTPNPNAMKFILDRRVVAGSQSRTINSPAAAQGDALAESLFAIAGVTGLFMVDDFVTVLKTDAASWDLLTPEVTAALARGFN